MWPWILTWILCATTLASKQWSPKPAPGSQPSNNQLLEPWQLQALVDRFALDDDFAIGGQLGDALGLDLRIDRRGGVGASLLRGDGGRRRRGLGVLLPEQHPVSEAWILVGHLAELVIDD